jgi:hypothetical protein
MVTIAEMASGIKSSAMTRDKMPLLCAALKACTEPEAVA